MIYILKTLNVNVLSDWILCRASLILMAYESCTCVYLSQFTGYHEDSQIALVKFESQDPAGNSDNSLPQSYLDHTLLPYLSTYTYKKLSIL